MTSGQLEALREFNERGLEDLSSGIGDAAARKAARCRIREIAQIRNRVSLKDLDELEPRVVLISARWISSDLYDRCGFYRAARHCLRESDHVKALINSLPLPTTRTEYRLAWSLHMFRILESVSKHRSGDRIAAAELSEVMQKKLDHLLRHARATGERDQDVLFSLDQLGWRTAYASGRHFLSSGSVAKAELALGRALEFCSESRKRFEFDSGRRASPEPQHILFWTGTILAALARTALAQGRLESAMRQLHVARTILCNTLDRIGIAFVNSLLGGVYRERGQEEKAIDHLGTSLEVFRQERHERYSQRTFYELVRTFINSNRWEEAELALSQPAIEEGRRLFRSTNTASQERWEATNLLLWSRVKLARRDHIGAQVDADKCLSKIAHHSEDVRLQAHAVLGEVALCQGRYSDAIRSCSAGLALNPQDPTDRSWLMLILSETYLRRRHIESAKYWFEVDPWAETTSSPTPRRSLKTARPANLLHSMIGVSGETEAGSAGVQPAEG